MSYTGFFVFCFSFFFFEMGSYKAQAGLELDM